MLAGKKRTALLLLRALRIAILMLVIFTAFIAILGASPSVLVSCLSHSQTSFLRAPAQGTRQLVTAARGRLITLCRLIWRFTTG